MRVKLTLQAFKHGSKGFVAQPLVGVFFAGLGIPSRPRVAHKGLSYRVISASL
jgi:hypothetical protein